MARKRFTAEQIIMKLREAEVGLAQGQTVGQVCKQIGVTEQTYYRWRKEYGGLRLNQAKRLKVLERALVNRCGKTSGGFLLRDLVDRDSIDIFGALVDVFHQLRCLQPAESLLRHQQHLPDHRLGVFHFLESLGRVRSQPKSGKR